MNKQNGYYYSLFKSENNKFIYGFSTASLGDMRNSSAYRSLLTMLKITSKDSISMKQIHANTVKWVTLKQGGMVLENIDGLLTSERNLYLFILVADCVPIFLLDSVKGFIGAVHAGWRGLYSEIIKETVDLMRSKGSNVQDIRAVIGPCIRVECYQIQMDQKKHFTEKFKDVYNENEYMQTKNGDIFMDIAVLAKLQLIHSGLNKNLIEDVAICTKDDPDFFSYRKQRENSGRFAGFIAQL